MHMDIDIVPCDYSGMCPYVDDGHSCEDRCGGIRSEMKGEWFMKTVRATWYEAWIKKGYGAKLADRYSNQREAKTAIKKAIEKQKEAGYKPDEFYIMIVDHICTYDENGDTISETTTYARV